MEFNTTLPIYLQVVTAIKHDIVNGKMSLGDKLPSVREIALQYTINPNTASRVYKELESEGICFTKRGMGTFVTEDPAIITRMKESMAELLVKEYMEGMGRLGYSRQDALLRVENAVEAD